MSALASSQSLRDVFELAAKQEVERWSNWPSKLREAGAYVFLGGGKRVRPVLALSCAQLFGPADKAVPWALAVELIHTYSLVHDDLPAMDNDDERRGRPTCHRAFDEGTAILVGDALLTRAFECLSLADYDLSTFQNLVRLLGSASGGAGMVGGQVDDLFGDLSTLDKLVAMQNKKTGALLRAAAVGGAIATGATADSIRQLEIFGEGLGLLFQLTDDIIDKSQDAERDSNNFHHHLSDAEVQSWRDQLVNTCHSSLKDFNEDTTVLVHLIDQISTRRV